VSAPDEPDAGLAEAVIDSYAAAKAELGGPPPDQAQVVISPNTALALWSVLRRGTDPAPELVDRLESAMRRAGWPPPELDAVRFVADKDAPPAGPGGTPKINLRISTEIEGEWVDPEMIAYAAHQLAASFVAKLHEVADEAAKEGM
jgi:hypothetical protein